MDSARRPVQHGEELPIPIPDDGVDSIEDDPDGDEGATGGVPGPSADPDYTLEDKREMRLACCRNLACPKGYGCQPGGMVSALVGVHGRSQITNQPILYREMTKQSILDYGAENIQTKLFCIPLDKFSSSIQFIILSIAVFIFYVAYGFILELIFTLDGMRLHGWFLTLIQFGLYSTFAFLQLTINRKRINNKIPSVTYLLIAALTVGTMGFSNTSMGYLNYPTQVIFKSCKLIPVMLGSVIILKKKYTVMQVAACVLMTMGLIWFTLADTVVQPSFSTKGIVLISLALLCDAVIGNVQEGAMRNHDESSVIVVLYSYSFGFVLILAALVFSGSFLPALQFSLMHPWEVYGRCTFLSFTGFCGVQVVLLMIQRFGALVAVTVTTFRKALSICLSFLIFSKPFTIHYVWGGLLVAVGIYLNVVGKRQSSGFFIKLQKMVMSLSILKNTYHRPFKRELLEV